MDPAPQNSITSWRETRHGHIPPEVRALLMAARSPGRPEGSLTPALCLKVWAHDHCGGSEFLRACSPTPSPGHGHGSRALGSSCSTAQPVPAAPITRAQAQAGRLSSTSAQSSETNPDAPQQASHLPASQMFYFPQRCDSPTILC